MPSRSMAPDLRGDDRMEVDSEEDPVPQDEKQPEPGPLQPRVIIAPAEAVKPKIDNLGEVKGGEPAKVAQPVSNPGTSIPDRSLVHVPFFTVLVEWTTVGFEPTRAKPINLAG